MTKEKLIENNKELFWDIPNLDKLDNFAIEERFLKYWNWQNIIDIQDLIWKDKLKEDYKYLRDKKRTNFSPKTINFFNLYFNV